MTLHRTNREGHGAWNIPDLYGPRRPGISAMVRLKDEETFVTPALRSIAPLVDEIVAVVQPSTDATVEILLRRLAELPHLRMLYYPWESRPNGPGHDAHPADSVHDRSFFYNWCLAQTRHQYVLKWDGDMVALPGLGGQLRGQTPVGWLWGAELVSVHPRLVSLSHPRTACEPRLFPVEPGWHYAQGPICEVLRTPVGLARQPLAEPAFVHLKYCKPEYQITKAWPANWREVPHFQRLMARGEPGEAYRGPWPRELSGLAPSAGAA